MLMRASGSVRALGTLVALAIIWLVFGLKSQYFFTEENIWQDLPPVRERRHHRGRADGGDDRRRDRPLDRLARGAVGSVAAVVIINHGYSIYIGIAAGLGATVLCGLVSGLITWKLKVVSFISTLAMLGIAQGAAFLLTNGQAVAGFGETYDKIGTFTCAASRARRSSRSPSSSSCT